MRESGFKKISGRGPLSCCLACIRQYLLCPKLRAPPPPPPTPGSGPVPCYETTP